MFWCLRLLQHHVDYRIRRSRVGQPPAKISESKRCRCRCEIPLTFIFRAVAKKSVAPLFPQLCLRNNPSQPSVDVQTFWWAIFHVEPHRPRSIVRMTEGNPNLDSLFLLPLSLLCSRARPFSSKPTVSFSASARDPSVHKTECLDVQFVILVELIGGEPGSPKNCRCIICNSKEHRSSRGACGDVVRRKGWREEKALWIYSSKISRPELCIIVSFLISLMHYKLTNVFKKNYIIEDYYRAVLSLFSRKRDGEKRKNIYCIRDRN